MRFATFMTPGGVMFLSVSASAVAWLLPGESLYLRGFEERAPTSVAIVLTLVFWYAACATCLVVGRYFGAMAKPSAASTEMDEDPAFGRIVLVILSALAAIGIFATYSQIVGSISISSALNTSTGNALSEALDGGAGLTTLRYATVAATALAIFRRLTGQREPVLLVGNLVMLLMSALVTSRLSLIMCAVMVVYVYSKARPDFSVRLRTVAVVGVLGFVVLGSLNFVRNANYYESVNVENPVAMNYYQIASYLGAPMQASLGTADALLQRKLEPPPGVVTEDVITPTFLRQTKGDKSVAIDPNRYGVSILVSLNTNSVFADTYVDYGPRGLFYVLVLLVVVGAVFGRFNHFRGPSALVAGTCLYGIAELWRLFLFNQGLAVFLIIGQVFVLLFARMIYLSARTSNRSRRPVPAEAQQASIRHQ